MPVFGKDRAPATSRSEMTIRTRVISLYAPSDGRAAFAHSQHQPFIERRARHHMRGPFGDEDHFLQTHAAAAANALDPDERLDSEHHARLELIGRRARQGFADIGRLVCTDADSMADEERKEAASQSVFV